MAPPLCLLVEDEPQVVLLVRRLGRRAGCDVAACPGVPQACQFLQACRPDLVILDMNLPGENGLVLCRRLRAAPAWANLPVALFTTWDVPGHVVAGLEAGVDFVLSKDLLCDPDAWQERLREILAPVDSRPPPLPLCWRGTPPGPATPEEVAPLNRALRHFLVRRLGPEVTQALVRRALGRAEPAYDAGWLSADGLGLEGGRLAEAGRLALVAPFAIALAEQTWRLGGTAASAPLREALAAALPRPGGSGPDESGSCDLVSGR